MRTLAIFLCILSYSTWSFACSSSICGQEPYIETRRIGSDECGVDEPYIDPFNNSRTTIGQLFSLYYPEEFAADGLSKSEAESTNDTAVRTGNEKATNVSYLDYSDVRVSNNSVNVEKFIEALKSSKLDEQERSRLTQKRIDIQMNIENLCVVDSPKDVEETSDYGKYVAATQRLYCLDYDASSQIFCDLKKSDDPWISEHAHYLCGRVLLLASQNNWSGSYSYDQNIRKELASKAEAALEEYSKNFPNGLYFDSAVGLKRRAAYFCDDPLKYIQFYVTQLQSFIERKDKSKLKRLLDEFNNVGLNSLFFYQKELPAHPLLGAAVIIDNAKRGFTEDELRHYSDWISQQSNALQKYPGLHELLQSFIFFNVKKFEELSKINASTLDARLRIPVELLQIAALEETQEWDEALDKRSSLKNYVKSTYPSSHEIEDSYTIEQYRSNQTSRVAKENGIALRSSKFYHLKTLLLKGELAAVFKNSVSDIPVWGKQLVIQKGLSEDALESLMSDEEVTEVFRVTAKETLLRMKIYEGRFEDAKEIAAEPLKVGNLFSEFSDEIYDQLASDNSHAKAQIVLANFIVNDNLQDYNVDLSEDSVDSPFFSTLLSTPHFRNKRIIKKTQLPLQLFSDAIETAKKADDQELQAEAIYHFLKCFQSTNWGYSCKGSSDNNEIETKYPKEYRKMLFGELKNELTSTEASKRLSYWY